MTQWQRPREIPLRVICTPFAGWTDKARQAKRDELRHVLTAAVCARGDAEGDGEVRYYQGMHDVAAVLLFELGERPAYVLLHRLARCQLRDSTRCAASLAASFHACAGSACR